MRRSLIAAFLFVALPVTDHQGRAQVPDDTYLAFHSFWEARRFAADHGGARCAVRAIHPAIADGEVFWIFNTDHRDALPYGYLSVDPRFGRQSTAGEAIVDGVQHFALRSGSDHSMLSRAEDSQRLLAAMRDGMDMSIVITSDEQEPRALTLSLAGFTRASDAARAACDF